MCNGFQRNKRSMQNSESRIKKGKRKEERDAHVLSDKRNRYTAKSVKKVNCRIPT